MVNALETRSHWRRGGLSNHVAAGGNTKKSELCSARYKAVPVGHLLGMSTRAWGTHHPNTQLSQ